MPRAGAGVISAPRAPRSGPGRHLDVAFAARLAIVSEDLLSIGERVDRYVVEGALGEGGMAVVYRLRHETLGSFHALKVLKVDRADIRARLVTEGQLQAALRHPNIVAVNDVLNVKGRTGLLMELVEGPSLYEWLYDHQPTPGEALEIFRGILAGVARAHRAGLVHRDLKAANVLLDETDGRLVPKVTDFGLAKVLDDAGDHTQTRTGMALGTPRYMAPEQIRNSKEVDARADVFALGCLLYRLSCGRDPFESDDTFALFESICHGKYPAPESLNPAIAPTVRAAIVGALTPDRERRLADCETLMAVLDGEVRVKTRKPGEVGGTSSQRLPRVAPPAPATAVSSAPWLALGAVSIAGGAVVIVLLGVVGYLWATREGPATAVAVPAGAVTVAETPGSGTSTAAAAAVESQPPPAAPAPVAAPVIAPTPAKAPAATAPIDRVAVRPEKPPREADSSANPALPSTPPSPPTGTVRATGDAAVVLVGNGKRRSPGVVPVGTYEVLVTFPGRDQLSVGNLTVTAGGTVRVVCDAAFANCTIQ